MTTASAALIEVDKRRNDGSSYTLRIYWFLYLPHTLMMMTLFIGVMRTHISVRVRR
jgi:hypothetical protein